MNASTLLRTSFAALALVAVGVAESNAQQPRYTGYVPIVHPTATAPAFATRGTIPGYANPVSPVAGTSSWASYGAVPTWTPAVATRPVLLIDPRLSSYETWAQYEGLGVSGQAWNDGVRHREHDHRFNQFGHRDGVDYR